LAGTHNLKLTTIERLKTKAIACAPVTEAAWGLRTTIRLPSGGHIGLYQPYHKTVLDPDT
jgi:hypothetical protein